MASRNGSARWDGDLQGGNGTVTVGDDVWTGAFSFASRFEEGEGTNPEELIAAAHAGCFSMALSGVLGKAGHEPQSIETTARTHLRQVDGKPTIAKIDLVTRGTVPGLDQADFQRHAEEAKADCPVSRALAGVGEMTVTATLA